MDFDFESLEKERKEIEEFLSRPDAYASGDFAAAIYPGTKHKNCDIAAAKVIVEEAGGKVTDLFGGEQRYDGDINGALISNGTVHAEALEIIKKHVIINK